MLRRTRGVLRQDLRLTVGGVVAVLEPQTNLLLTVVDLRRLNVLGVELGDRDRGVDGLEVAGVVAEVAEGIDHQQHDGYE